MEPPSKRLRLDSSLLGVDDDDEENQDELSMTAAQFDASQDPMYQLDKGRAKAATRLKSTFEDIFAKYGKDFDGDDDVINFYTDEIEVDNGHVQSLEMQKDGVTKDSPSSDEEERILSGKSGGREKREKSQSKSLTPANRPKHSLDSSRQFSSPWNSTPGLGTYRLSSLAFSSSPYNAYPPFDFGPSPFKNGPIDPVWQAPDLPAQPNRQPASLIGAARNQFDSFGAPPHHGARKLVSAKSFLLRAASTSRLNDDDMEEGDILLSRNKQDKLPTADSQVLEKTQIPITSNPDLNLSSQRPGLHPPFLGIGPTKDSVDNPPDGLGNKSIRNKSKKPRTTKLSSAPHQIAGSSRNSSPTHPKRGRPKKSETPRSTTIHTEEPNIENRLLQPNERRIEIIIPMMKRLSPVEMEPEQAAKQTTPVIDGVPEELHIEQRVSFDESREIPRLESSPPTSPPIRSHESAVFHQSRPNSTEEPRGSIVKHSIQTPKSPNNAPKLVALQDSQKQEPKRTQEQLESPLAHIPPSDEQNLENIGIEARQEPMSSQTVVDHSTTNCFITNSSLQIEEELDYDSENDRMALDQQGSSIADVGRGEEHTTNHTSLVQNIETMLVDECNPPTTSYQSPPPAEPSQQGAVDSTIEISSPATPGVPVPETTISEELETLPRKTEDLPRDDLGPKSVESHGEELLPVHQHTPNDDAPRFNLQFNEVLGTSRLLTSYEARISTHERDIVSLSPELSAVREAVRSESHLSADCILPNCEAPGTREDRDHDSPSQLSSSVPIAEIDGLQLDSDPAYPQRSPSPHSIELPDQDLSVFPTESDDHSISELTSRLSACRTRTGAQRNNTSTGRSPSPELGTPTGPEIILRGTSRAVDSPTPTTPTRKQGRSKGAKPRNSRRLKPSSKRFPLSSLLPGGIDDQSDDELSIASSFSSTVSRFRSPFSRASTDDNTNQPPLSSISSKTTRKYGLLTGSPSSARTPNRILSFDHGGSIPPATDFRAGRIQNRQARNSAVHSSPLARTVAERLLSSPAKRHRGTPQQPPSLVASPHGTLRRCGENGFVCERDFCLTCCK